MHNGNEDGKKVGKYSSRFEEKNWGRKIELIEKYDTLSKDDGIENYTVDTIFHDVIISVFARKILSWEKISRITNIRKTSPKNLSRVQRAISFSEAFRIEQARYFVPLFFFLILSFLITKTEIPPTWKYIPRRG